MSDEYSIDINQENIIIEVEQQPDVEIQLNEQGPPGPPGNGIVSITKTSSQGGMDIYTIYYTNGDTDTFQVPTPLIAGENIQIEDNVISAIDTTYTAGEGISIVDNVISNTQTSVEWGNIDGDITDQTDIIDLIDTKIGIEATTRENSDISLQNGINTLNDDLTAEISNRETVDGILQDNIDTLSGTVTSNYNTLNGKIGDNKTAIDNHKADKNNPHEVSKAQMGLGNVDNTSDLDKPISTATQNALDGKVPTLRTVNGNTLTSDIVLTASDVNALPDTTTINDLTTTEQQFAINSGANATNIGQIATNTNDIEDIEELIPSQATTSNQLADKNFVNSSIATNTANFIGTFNSVSDLEAYSGTLTNNDYAYVVIVDSLGNTAYDRYKYTTATTPASWEFEFELNNSSFTAEQWAAINSGITSGDVTLIGTAIQPSDLATVATSGSYSDLSNKPTIPNVNNNTITIQKNGITIDSFTLNQSSNETINITVPTDTQDLTNGAGYTTNTGTVTSVNGVTPVNGDVTLSIPAAQVNSDWNASSGVAQILNKPTLSTVATSGNYNDLSNKPTIPTKTSDLTNDSGFIPNTATGTYGLTILGNANSGTGAINIGTNSSATNFGIAIGYNTNSGDASAISIGNSAEASGFLGTAIGYTASASGSGSLAVGFGAEATSASSIQIGQGTNSRSNSLAVGFGTDKEYQLLNGITGLIPDERISSNIARTSDIPTNTSDLMNDSGYITSSALTPYALSADLSTVATTGDYDDLTNKPSLSTVATSGSYNDLTNKPTIPAAQVQANWNETDTDSKAYIQNKPTIPAVGDGTITITQGGVTKGTFTTNQSGNKTIDLDAGGGGVTVDDELSTTSTNPVQNKVITGALSDKQDVLTEGNAIDIVSSQMVDTRETATITTSGSGNWLGIAYGNGVYVICGASGKILYSSDGETWTQVTVGSSNWQEVCYANGVFVAVGNSGYISTSSNGSTWTTPVKSAQNISRWQTVTYINGMFIAGGLYSYNYNSYPVLTTSSDNGETWTAPVTIGSTGGRSNCIIYGNGVYVSLHESGYLYHSSDLSNWTQTQVGTREWVCGLFVNNKFYVLGDSSSGSSNLLTSDDGANWTLSTGTAFSTQAVIYKDNTFIAVGGEGRTSVSLDNGVTWESPAVLVGTSTWYDILSVEQGEYITVGSSGKIANFDYYPITGNIINVICDNVLSSSSKNPVQNKIINSAITNINSAISTIETSLNNKVPTSRTVNGKALTSDITLATSDISNCESTTNKVTSISSNSTNTEYPTAKCMYDIIGDVETLINAL